MVEKAATRSPDGKAVKLRVIIEGKGLQGVLLENVRAYLELYQKREDPGLTAVWMRHLHQKAVKEIQQALQPYGFYNVLVDSSLEERSPGNWVARYVVTPGPRTRIRKVDVQWTGEGAEEPELQRLAQRFPLAKGNFLAHAIYEHAKDELLMAAEALGYRDARARVARILVDPENNVADIELQLETGPQYHIGDIRLQQDALDPDFIRRYLVDVKPGDVYSATSLLNIQKDLIEAGYYSLVDVAPRFEQAQGDRVPVEVLLTPAKRQSYTFSAGYDTDIGLNLSARWQHRRLNKVGHKADALLKLSLKESRLQGNYWIPIRDPRNNKLGFTAKLINESTDSSKRHTIDLEAGYYLLWNEWNFRAFTQLKFERFMSGTEPETSTMLWSLGAFGERSWFEKGNYPRRAWHLLGEAQVSPGWISSTHYFRLRVKGGVFLPLFENGRLLLRSELGTTTVGDFDKYPNSLRFYAGGDGSVRGYEWKALGPKDNSGDVIGGLHLLTFNLEYDHRVLDEWVAAVFVDAGNAFDKQLDKLYVGAGVGVRWLSPVGSIRLDLGWPMNNKNDDPQLSSVRVHFGFEVGF